MTQKNTKKAVKKLLKKLNKVKLGKSKGLTVMIDYNSFKELIEAAEELKKCI